jgi:hypothetical protein
MAYTFKFFSPSVQQGDRCDFYGGFPATAAELGGEAPPLAGTTLGSSLLATLSNPGSEEEIAIVLERSGSVYGRSNSLPLSRFDEAAENDIYVTPLSETVSLSELTSYVPPTPFTEDNITVTSVNVDLRPPNLVLSGHATSDGWWFFDLTIDFEYVCALVPVTNPIWFDDDSAKYVSIEQVDFKVDGKNLLQDIILLIGSGAIRTKLEDRLVTDLNADVRQRLSALGDAAATVSDVTITSGAVTIDITVVSPDSLCPLAMSMQSPAAMRTRSRAEIHRMRRIRDQVLPGTARGPAYAEMLSRHRTELTRLLGTRPDVATTFYAALDRVAAELGRRGLAELSVSAESVDAVRRTLDALLPHASPSLRSDLLAVRERLEGTRGVSARELLA